MGNERGCAYGDDEVKSCRRRLFVYHNSCRERILTLLFPHRYYNYVSKMWGAQNLYYHASWVFGIELDRVQYAVDVLLRSVRERSG